MFTKSYGAATRRGKYNNRIVEIDGRKFHSKKESEYYSSLKLQLLAKHIAGFDCQVPFKITHNGVKLPTYIADFVIYSLDGTRKVVDVKGYKKGPAWAVFRAKALNLKAFYGIDIEIV